MIENLKEIKKEALLSEVQNMMYNGYRMVTATCVDLGDAGLEVTYHFDKDFELSNFRLTVGRDEEVDSISKIYFCALLVENEMKELFGLKVKNIVIDYGGHMLLTDEALANPFAKNQITIEKREGKKDE
jgi:ech hydrogenase subunit D